jgi:hypothetical protein
MASWCSPETAEFGKADQKVMEGAPRLSGFRDAHRVNLLAHRTRP